MNKPSFFILAAIAIIIFAGLTVYQPLAALLLVIALPFIFIFLRYPHFGFKLIILLVLFGNLLRFSAAGTNILVLDFILAAYIITWLIKKVIQDRDVQTSGINIPLITFLVWALVMLIFNTVAFHLGGKEFLLSFFYWLRYVEYVFIFWIALDLLRDDKQRKVYLNWLLAVAVGLAVLGFVQFAFVPNFEFMQKFGWDPHLNRLLSTFFDPNFLGGFLAINIGLALSRYCFSDSRKDKNWLLAIIIVLLAAVGLTFSRSAYLTLLVVVLVIAAVKDPKLVLGMIIVFLLAVGGSGQIRSRVIGALQMDVTSQLRVESWQEGFDLAKPKLLTGYGYNTLPIVLREEGLREEGVHSAAGTDASMINILLTTGIPGLLIFIWFYLEAILLAFKSYIGSPSSITKTYALAAIAMLLGIFVHSWFTNSLFYSFILVWFWIILAGALSIHEK